MKHWLPRGIFFSICLLLTSCQSSTTNQQLAAKVKVPPIGVQLWSVRDAVKADFKGTLKELAAMGFDGVEFAGDYGPYADDPTGLKAFLTSINLKVSGAHTGFHMLTPDKIDQTLSFFQKLGAKLINIGMDKRAWHAEQVTELTADLTRLADKFAEYGLTFGYHNHDQEFNTFQTATYWDYIAKNTPNHVGLQLDVGWVNYAGKNPITYVERYPNRTLTTHIKVRTHQGSTITPIIGKDGYDWAALIKTMIATGGTQWLVLEQEEYPNGLSSMASVAKSKQGLDNIISNL